MRKTLLLSLCLSTLAVNGEDLDLSQLKAFDWRLKEFGGQTKAQALISPTADPLELVECLKKKFGVRLTTENREHVIVISVGALAAHGDLKMTRANIDRIRKLIEIDVQLLRLRARPLPKTSEEIAAARVKSLEEAAPGEIQITPAAPPKKGRQKGLLPEPPPVARTRDLGGNPTFLLPIGVLEAGTWWLQVTTNTEGEAKGKVTGPVAHPFIIKDHRNYQKKGGKGHNTPEVGLKKPDSPSVLDGMGGGP